MSLHAEIAPDDAVYTDFALEAGFEFPPFDVTLSMREQRRLHEWCDIPEHIFGAHADPALVSRRPIVLLAHTVLAQRPRWAPVHAVQRIVQRRPVMLDETLRLYGRIERFAPHVRGEIMHSIWRYLDAAGACVFEVHPQVLLIDPEHSAVPAANPRAPDTRRRRVVGYKQCTPEATLGYCEGTHNPIHLDPAIAASFGFRAPIIAGTQTMSYLLEGIYRAQTPHAIELSIGFHRPVFWDDKLALEAEAGPGGVRSVRAVNAAGKTTAECSIVTMT